MSVETMIENFPNMGKKTDIWTREAHFFKNAKIPTPKHIIILMSKVRAARENVLHTRELL